MLVGDMAHILSQENTKEFSCFIQISFKHSELKLPCLHVDNFIISNSFQIFPYCPPLQFRAVTSHRAGGQHDKFQTPKNSFFGVVSHRVSPGGTSQNLRETKQKRFCSVGRGPWSRACSLYRAVAVLPAGETAKKKTVFSWLEHAARNQNSVWGGKYIYRHFCL